jgi:hypothetical protein
MFVGALGLHGNRHCCGGWREAVGFYMVDHGVEIGPPHEIWIDEALGFLRHAYRMPQPFDGILARHAQG